MPVGEKSTAAEEKVQQANLGGQRGLGTGPHRRAHLSVGLLSAGASAFTDKFSGSKEIPWKSDREGTCGGTYRWCSPPSSGFSGPQHHHFPSLHVFLRI